MMSCIENKTTEIEYKVQIASGKNKIATKSYNFRGLKNVERVAVGSFFKYYYGASSLGRRQRMPYNWQREKDTKPPL